MKEAVNKIAERRHPELANGMYLPIFGVVMAVPDPPIQDGQCTEVRPRYAVAVQLLKENGDPDLDMPPLLDVPVAMTGAAPHRGFAALPQPGTVVEIAFAFGLPNKPFVRSILPYELPLPAIDALSQRWQQTDKSYQEIDGVGNHRRQTNLTITDRAEIEIATIAPKHWIGSEGDNFLQMVADFMASVIAALDTLAAHTHPVTETGVKPPVEAPALSACSGEVTAEKGRLEVIKK